MNSQDEIGCLEAEGALVGCMLLGDAGVVREVLGRLEPTDLTDPRHRTIVAAVRALVDAGTRPDPATVVGQLRRTGAARSFTADRDVAVYLADLTAAPLSVGSATAYLAIILEHAWRRQVEAAGIRLQQVAGTTGLDVLEQVVADELRALDGHAVRWHRPAPPLRTVSGAA